MFTTVTNKKLLSDTLSAFKFRSQNVGSFRDMAAFSRWVCMTIQSSVTTVREEHEASYVLENMSR